MISGLTNSSLSFKAASSSVCDNYNAKLSNNRKIAQSQNVIAQKVSDASTQNGAQNIAMQGSSQGQKLDTIA